MLRLEIVLQEKHNGLQIFGFLVTVYFVQKGINGILEAFNATYHNTESRQWIDQRLVSVGLFRDSFCAGNHLQLYYCFSATWE